MPGTKRKRKKPKLYPRYQARFDKEFNKSWCVWDTIRDGPYMTADDRADAIRAAKVVNDIHKEFYPRGYKRPVKLTVANQRHFRSVVRRNIAEAKDKYDLTNKLADYLSYACDRLCDERIFYIQLWWEAIQRANGFEPIVELADRYDYARGM